VNGFNNIEKGLNIVSIPFLLYFNEFATIAKLGTQPSGAFPCLPAGHGVYSVRDLFRRKSEEQYFCKTNH
jgi:hypothetical protein